MVEPAELEGASLRTLLTSGLACLREARSSGPPSPERTAKTLSAVARGLEHLREARLRTQTLALFSRNEEAGDVATSNLIYLLLPFCSAQLLAAVPAGSDHGRRLQALRQAQTELGAFLDHLNEYGLAGPVASERGEERWEERKEARGSGSGMVDGLDPAKKRARKLAAHARRRTLRCEMDAHGTLEQWLGLADGGGGAWLGREGAADGEDEQGEQDREKILLRLEWAALEALDALDGNAQELQILTHALKMQEDGRPMQDAPTDAQDLLQALRGIAGGLAAGPAVRPPPPDALRGLSPALARAAERGRLRAEVFRPSTNGPRLSVEQFGMLEAREAREREARQKEAEQRRAREKAGEKSDDEETDQRNSLKARAWDDWKDDNPYGHGNSKRRPTG